MTQEPAGWFSSLYQNNYTRLYRTAYRLTGSGEAAEELVQDTFLLAWSHQNMLMDHPAPDGWLMLTLTNLIRNERRRFSSQELSLDEVIPQSAPEEDRGIGELLPAKLSEKDRQILIWRFELRMDYREIADRLGISEAGCRSRVSRALENCRKFLKKYPPT